MLGFGGDDVYFVTDPGDRVLEDAGGGFDIRLCRSSATR